MKVKPVPPPPDSIAAIEDARRAVPLVPGSEADCCSRIMDRLGLASRDEARVWLTFLRGLGLVESGPNGFVRTADDVDLTTGLLEGVYGAAAVLEALDAASGRVRAETVADRVPVPPWERRRHQDAARRWADRVGAILDWFVLLGEATRTTEGYVRD